MPRQDAHHTDPSGLEPTELPSVSTDQDTQDALTRVHSSGTGSARHQHIRASDRLAAVRPTVQRPSARHQISSGSTRTAIPAHASGSSGRIATASRRLPAAQFLGQGGAHPHHSKRMTFAILLGIAGPVVIIIALVWMMRPDELSVRAGAALADGERQMQMAREAIAARRAGEALRIIDVPTPGDAALAGRLKALNAQFQQLLGEAQRVERDQKVEQNLSVLNGRFARMGELDNAGLDALERQGMAFIANPVNPGAEADPVAIEAYRTQVDDIRRSLDQIKTSRQRLAAAQTTVQETKAHTEVADLVRKERFQDALALVADYRQKFPAGKFDDHQSFIESAAKRSWEAAKMYAESRIQDARSVGIPAAKRKQAIEQARKRLNEVVANFGIADQVEAAKALLQQLPPE